MAGVFWVRWWYRSTRLGEGTANPTFVVTNAVRRELSFGDDIPSLNAVLHELHHPLEDLRHVGSNDEPPAAGCYQPDDGQALPGR